MVCGCPWFAPSTAWSCIVISCFAVVILGSLSLLFNARHEEMVGGVDDPSPQIAPEIASTLGMAVLLYIVTIVGCYCNIVFAKRASRRGQIALQ